MGYHDYPNLTGTLFFRESLTPSSVYVDIFYTINSGEPETLLYISASRTDIKNKIESFGFLPQPNLHY